MNKEDKMKTDKEILDAYTQGRKDCIREIRTLIEKDIKYQKGLLTLNCKKDRPVNWRIVGFKNLLKNLK